MNSEFRQKTPGEIWQIIKRRKWHLLLPTLAIGIAVAWVIRTLPETYESTTLLTIKPPTISDKVVQSLSDEDMSQRLQTINQNVLSRSSLESILTKLKIFEDEKAAGVPTELIVDRMRKNITVAPVSAGNDKISGFRITYRDRSPETARDVTAALAAKYVNEQVLTSTQSAETTSEFINQQLEQAKSTLDSLERERLGIMTQNVEALPESAQGLIAQLEGLRQREQMISKEKEGLIAERGRINDSIRALNSQSRLIEDFGEKETQQAVSEATRIEDTPAYAQLVQRRAELRSKLENLKLSFKEKHPKVIEAQNDIDKVNDEIEELSKNTQKRVQQANQAGARKAELQKKNLEIEKQKAESQIAQIESQFEAKDEELRRNAAMIASLETKINAIPNVKVALEGITARYQTAKTAYDEILKKYNNAQGQVQRETNEQGETIRVIDPANLPQSPVNASKKPLFMVIGFSFGLFVGVLFAVVLEIPQISKIQNIEDMKHYTGLPILASVPPLLSDQEISRKKGIHLTKVFAGILIALASIPLLILGLEKTRILERFL